MWILSLRNIDIDVDIDIDIDICTHTYILLSKASIIIVCHTCYKYVIIIFLSIKAICVYHNLEHIYEKNGKE